MGVLVLVLCFCLFFDNLWRDPLLLVWNIHVFHTSGRNQARTVSVGGGRLGRTSANELRGGPEERPKSGETAVRHGQSVLQGDENVFQRGRG